MLPAFTLLFGLMVWLGTEGVFGFAARGMEKLVGRVSGKHRLGSQCIKTFPGTGKEFMPSLNEGSFLLMPTSMPHSSIEKNLDYVETLDKRLPPFLR